MRPLIQRIVAWGALAVGALVMLLVAVIALAAGGVMLPFPVDSEISDQAPYTAFIGREFLVISDVTATISLIPPPSVANRFVSKRVPLKRGQTMRIASAWKHFELIGFGRYYVVSLPGAGLPEGVPIHLRVNSDGIPNPEIYEPQGKQREAGFARIGVRRPVQILQDLSRDPTTSPRKYLRQTNDS